MHLLEVGKVYSAKNLGSIIAAYKSLRTALGELLADEALNDPEDAPKEDEKPPTKVKEAASWSLSDTANALARELAEKVPNAYILDIFPEENLIVYQVGWRGGYYECGYAIDATGVATFTDPIEVSRKVNYVRTSDGAPTPIPITTDESAQVEIIGNEVALIERAVTDNGLTMLKLISPGSGSSGYYGEEVLKRDGPKVFVKGLHNFIDHPTAQEEAQRPEGSIDRLGSILAENAQWRDSYIDTSGVDQGKGLYARAQVTPDFREKLNTIAGDIGVSIRAVGQARIGTIDGKQQPIIETITQAKSADYVTLAGRGGKVIELLESARIKGVDAMAIDDKQLQELQESNRALADQVHSLRGALVRNQADQVVTHTLTAYPTLPAQVKQRITASIGALELPINEAGSLDQTKLVEAVKLAITNETAYLAQLGAGQLKGLGGLALQEGASQETLAKQIADNLAALG